jgi:hypothetical protein
MATMSSGRLWLAQDALPRFDAAEWLNKRMSFGHRFCVVEGGLYDMFLIRRLRPHSQCKELELYRTKYDVPDASRAIKAECVRRGMFDFDGEDAA